MTKLVVVGFTLLLALTDPQALAAQCTKRILVYLDVSGSMDPAGGSPHSPFAQSVQTLEVLLSERAFLDSGDAVEIVLFGERIEQRFSARGRTEVAAQLQRVRRWKPGNWTDFGVVFDDLENTLQEGTFNRQVVILASDFHHEPARTVPPEQSWGAVFGRWEQDLRNLFGDGQQKALLLFRAPTGAPAAAAVVQDLTRLVPPDQVLAVGRGGLGAAALAAKVREKLLFPPGVVARLDRTDFQRLEIRISNPNCYPLNLAEVGVTCRRADGSRGSDPVPVKVSAELVTLEPVGTPNALRVLTPPRPSGLCWEQTDAFEVVATTREGVVGRSQGTTRTTLDFEPIAGFIDHGISPFVRDVLRVELDLTGLVVEPDPFEIEVLSSSGGRLGQGRFEPPRDLDPEQKKRYQMIFPLPFGASARYGDGERASVRIGNGAAQPKTIDLHKDDLQTWQTSISFWITILSGGVISLLVWRHKANRSLDLPAAATWISLLAPALTILISSLALFARGSLRQLIPMSALDLFMMCIVGVTVAMTTYVVVRSWQRSQLLRAVFGPSLMTPEEYERKAGAGWKALAAAVLAVALVAVVGFALRPPGTPAEGRIPTLPLID